jgi:hypothetical protein
VPQVHTHIRIEKAIYLQNVNGFVHIRTSCAGRQNIARIGVLEGFAEKIGRANEAQFFFVGKLSTATTA